MKLNELFRQEEMAAGKDSLQSQTKETELLTGDRIQHLEAVLSVVRKINTSLVLSDVLSLVVGQAIRITQSDRGFLMLADKDKHLQYMIGQDKDGVLIPSESFKVSSSVLDDVFVTGESLCIEDALNDERFETRASVINLELKTILCAPLRTAEETIGVIYVDSRHIHAVRKEEIMQLFEILAGQVAIAIQNARLYENLRKAYNELQEANEHIVRSEKMVLRGEIAGEVTHELNNILTIALIQCSMLQRSIRKGDPEKAENDLKVVTQQLRRMTNFAENLLIGTSHSSKMGLVHFNTIIRNFVAFIGVLPKYKGATINVELDEDMGEVNVDVDQFQQVLLNISNNAMDACAQSVLTFKTEYHFVENIAKLIIADNGPGIDPKVKDKLFQERITTKPDGHGFGLPLCRKIIQNHKGEILVESEPGKGTQFIIVLPLPV